MSSLEDGTCACLGATGIVAAVVADGAVVKDGVDGVDGVDGADDGDDGDDGEEKISLSPDS